MNQAGEFLRSHAVPATRLVSDSRKVAAGDVFFAVPGASADGRSYIEAAASQGAAAIVYEAAGAGQIDSQVPSLAIADLGDQLGGIAADFYANPSAELDVIAITGTKGKTTTAAWCMSILGSAGRQAAYVGTLGAGTDLDRLENIGLTTPGTLEQHQLLAAFRKNGCSAVAMEASAHGLAQNRLAGIDCDIAVFTNLGSDHLDYFARPDDYVGAKRRLFTRPELSGAVVNADDRRAGLFIDACKVDTLRCGADAGCDISWQVAGVRPQGLEIVLQGLGADHRFILPAPGEFNAANAALAAGACLLAGVEWDELAAGLDSLPQLPGRMQQVGDGTPACYVDYAHTADSLAAALAALRQSYPQRRLVCVFGCGGDRDRDKRAPMGAAAAAGADAVVITTDNPRSEDPASIASEIASGAGNKATVVLDRAQAISDAIIAADGDDVVLVAGKGHERSMEGPDGSMTHFDDVAAVRQALASR